LNFSEVSIKLYNKYRSASAAATKIGDKVKVHYTRELTNGNIFDSSKRRYPLEFTI